MKKSLFLFAVLFSFNTVFSNPENKSLSNCDPTNITVVTQTDSSVSLDWDDAACSPIGYRVFYVKGGQTSQEFSTESSDITIGGLTSGTHQFHVYAVFANGTSSIIIDEVLM